MQNFKKIAPFFFLYLSEGAPIGLIWWALPAVLKTYGIETSMIATLSATIVIPWSLKFLLGPIVDLFCFNSRRLKIWIFIAQMMMLLSLIPLLLNINAAMPISTITIYLFIHAIFAASQDVGIDTLAIKTLPTHLLGIANGWMQGGMLAGRAIIGGAGLWLAVEYSPKITIACVIAILLLALIIVLRLKVSEDSFSQSRVSVRKYMAELKTALKGKTFWLALLLSYIIGFSFEGIGLVAGPLLTESGISHTSISYLFGIATPLSLSLAAIFGGRRSDQVGHKRGLNEALAGISFFVLVFAVCIGLDFKLFLLPAVVCIYIGIGWLTTSLYALLMEISDKKLAAVQFSAFMAMTNLCESTSGFFMGWGITNIGYVKSFLVLLAVSWFGFYLIQKISTQEVNVPSVP